MGLREFLSTNSSSDEDEASVIKKEVEETRTVTYHYTTTHSRVVYPDGGFENIDYTKDDFGDTVSKFYDHTKKDYQVRKKYYGSICKLRLYVDYQEPDRFVMRHIQSIETRWEDKMVAVAELDVVVEYEYERDGANDEWEQEDIRLDQDPDDLDVTVWDKREWEEQQKS